MRKFRLRETLLLTAAALFANEVFSGLNKSLLRNDYPPHDQRRNLTSERTDARRSGYNSTNYQHCSVLERSQLVHMRQQLLSDQLTVGQETRRIKTALCHKSLFGSVDLHQVSLWVAYHKLLGFDDLYIWHVPSIKELPGFYELERLPFVTLVENTQGRLKTYADGYTRLERGVGGDQLDDEKACLRLGNSSNYDWVMMADFDEYLWFGEQIRLKEFVAKHAPVESNITFLSFGKWMYTLEHQVKIQDPLLDLTRFPFTARSFCLGARKGKAKKFNGIDVCPTWKGRAKVLVQPRRYQDEIRIHGTNWFQDPLPDKVHFPTTVAHLKEWPNLTHKHIDDKGSPNSKTRAPRDFLVSDNKQVKLHALWAHKANGNGTFTMHYDAGLTTWFDFVIDDGGNTTKHCLSNRD